MHRTPAEDALLETVLRTRAALLEQTDLSPDEVLERLRASMREEVELAQRRAAAANEPLLPDPAATLEWLDDEVLGFGVLGPLMRTDSIQTIRIVGPHRIYVVENGHQHRLAGVRFRNDQAVRDLVKRFAALAGRPFDDAHPRADFCLPDGSRLHAVMPPISRQYTEVTIRRFTLFDQRIDALIPHTLSVPVAHFLEACVRGRANILISGDSGTGKTTLQRMLLLGIDDPDEWLITLESTWELQLDRLIGTCQTWQERVATPEGSGAITLGDLLEFDGLRSEATRLIVGECRKEEGYTLLYALNTGHRGTVTTIHSDSAADALERLLTAAQHAPSAPSEAVLRRMIASNIDIIVHLRKRGGERLVTDVVEVGREMEPGGRFGVRPLWVRQGRGPLVRQPYVPRLLERFADLEVPYDWYADADDQEAA